MNLQNLAKHSTVIKDDDNETNQNKNDDTDKNINKNEKEIKKG